MLFVFAAELRFSDKFWSLLGRR